MAERILFVDDEPDMEELIKQRLRKQVREDRFALEFAGNGRIALEKLKEFDDIRIIVTDINMPEMDGLTLLAELGKLDRPTRTLVVSAYRSRKPVSLGLHRAGHWRWGVKMV